jgi:hypothetical protein
MQGGPDMNTLQRTFLLRHVLHATAERFRRLGATGGEGVGGV